MEIENIVKVKFILKWIIFIILIVGVIIPTWVTDLLALIAIMGYLFFEQWVIQEFESIVKQSKIK